MSEEAQTGLTVGTCVSAVAAVVAAGVSWYRARRAGKSERAALRLALRADKRVAESLTYKREATIAAQQANEYRQAAVAAAKAANQTWQDMAGSLNALATANMPRRSLHLEREYEIEVRPWRSVRKGVWEMLQCYGGRLLNDGTEDVILSEPFIRSAMDKQGNPCQEHLMRQQNTYGELVRKDLPPGWSSADPIRLRTHNVPHILMPHEEVTLEFGFDTVIPPEHIAVMTIGLKCDPPLKGESDFFPVTIRFDQSK